MPIAYSDTIEIGVKCVDIPVYWVAVSDEIKALQIYSVTCKILR